MSRRIVGPQATTATVLFGEVLDGAEAERVGLVWRCVDDELLPRPRRPWPSGRPAARRDWCVACKATIADVATIDDHDDAVDRELDPQVWSLEQPDFAERLAALPAHQINHSRLEPGWPSAR